MNPTSPEIQEQNRRIDEALRNEDFLKFLDAAPKEAADKMREDQINDPEKFLQQVELFEQITPVIEDITEAVSDVFDKQFGVQISAEIAGPVQAHIYEVYFSNPEALQEMVETFAEQKQLQADVTVLENEAKSLGGFEKNAKQLDALLEKKATIKGGWTPDIFGALSINPIKTAKNIYNAFGEYRDARATSKNEYGHTPSFFDVLGTSSMMRGIRKEESALRTKLETLATLDDGKQDTQSEIFDLRSGLFAKLLAESSIKNAADDAIAQQVFQLSQGTTMDQLSKGMTIIDNLKDFNDLTGVAFVDVDQLSEMIQQAVPDVLRGELKQIMLDTPINKDSLDNMTNTLTTLAEKSETTGGSSDVRNLLVESLEDTLNTLNASPDKNNARKMLVTQLIINLQQ